jgi:hypothetical protein
MEDGRLTDLLSWLPGWGAGRRTSSAPGGAPASSSVALSMEKHRAGNETRMPKGQAGREGRFSPVFRRTAGEISPKPRAPRQGEDK